MVTQGPSQGLGLGDFSWESNGIRVEGLWDSKQTAQNEDSNEQSWGRRGGQVETGKRSPPEETEGRSAELPRAEVSVMVEEISPIWGRGRSRASLFTCLEPKAVGGLWDPMW